MDARAVLDRVAAASPQRNFTFVGIDGRGGAGKSTLAALIPGATVIGSDREAARETWVERWMPMEDRYVERDNPVACADIVVDGG